MSEQAKAEKNNKRPSEQRGQTAEVVDLISSDEDDIREPVRKVPRSSKASPSRSPSKSVNRKRRVIDDADDGDDDDEVVAEDDDLEVVSFKIAPKSKSNNNAKGGGNDAEHSPASQHMQSEPSTPSQGRQGKFDKSGYDGTSSKRASDKRASNGGAGNEALEVVESRSGIQPLVDYAHFRFQCAANPFKRQRIQRKKMFCHNCYCYVCDIPAEKCGQWEEHCVAVDNKSSWQNLRRAKMDDRRKLAVDPAKRGTLPSRVTTPVVVQGVPDDDGDSDDEDGGGEQASMELLENAEWYDPKKVNLPDDMDYALKTLQSVVIDADTFHMSDISKALELPRSSDRLTALGRDTDQWFTRRG